MSKIDFTFYIPSLIKYLTKSSCAALVDTLSISQSIQMVEHLEQSGRRLVDGTDNGPAASGQGLQQRYTLEARGTVQARRGLIEEHDGRVVYEFQGY